MSSTTFPHAGSACDTCKPIVTTDPPGAKSLHVFDLLGPTTHSIANNIGNSAGVPDNVVVVIALRYCLSRRNDGPPAGRPYCSKSQ